MPTPNRPLKPELVELDRDIITAVLALTDYKPSNVAYAKDTLTAKVKAADDAHASFVNAEAALAAARDAEVTAEYALHDAALCAKQQVIAQYGPNSDEVQSLGLKKKSERKRPVRRAKSA